MKLSIIGASGGTGQCLVAQALAEGHEISVLQHHSNDFGKAAKNQSVRVVTGSVLDFFAVEEVIRGSHAVLCALGTKDNSPDTHILSQGTRNIVAAMQRLGVRRLVCESSLGVGDSITQTSWFFSRVFLPLFLKHIFADKLKQEAVIRASDLQWIIVRPAALTNGKMRGHYRTASETDKTFRGQSISRADVAAFMLQQVQAETGLQQVVTVSG
jgi:putative NADH-flavin reductase